MRAPAGLDRLVVVCGLSQAIGWGTTYFLPGVLGEQFEQSTGLSRPMVMAGITVMLLVASATSATAGAVIERRGARDALLFSWSALAVGLVVLALWSGPVGYYVAWAIFGVGMPFGLSGGVQAALVQFRGAEARRGMSYVLMILSFSQAAFWPLTAWLTQHFGMRVTLLIFAGLNLLVVALLLAVARGERRDGEAALTPAAAAELLPEDKRRRGAVLLIIANAGTGFVTWGMEINMLQVLTAFGIGQAVALGVIMLRGPVSLVGRSIDIVSGGRLSPVNVAIFASLLLLVALGVPFVMTGWFGACVFVVLFSAGASVLSISRATLQLTLFGPIGFAALAGRMNQPTTFAYAIAAPAIGLTLEAFGPQGAIWVSILAMLCSLLALIELKRMARR